VLPLMRQQVPTGFSQSRFEYQMKERIVKIAFTPVVAQRQIDIGKKELTMVVDHGTIC